MRRILINESDRRWRIAAISPCPSGGAEPDGVASIPPMTSLIAPNCWRLWSLPPRQRATIVLRYLDGLTERETAGAGVQRGHGQESDLTSAEQAQPILHPRGASPVMTHDESRLSEALHELVDAQPFEPDLGTIERRGRQVRRRATATRSVAGLGLAAVAAAALAVSGAISTQSGTRANPLTTPTTTALHGGPLVALAADITAHQLHQPGNATLVVSLGLTRVGKHLQYSEGDRGAELFTDAGKYYDASLDPPSDASSPPAVTSTTTPTQ